MPTWKKEAGLFCGSFGQAFVFVWLIQNLKVLKGHVKVLRVVGRWVV
jgi:hypothetical protein